MDMDTDECSSTTPSNTTLYTGNSSFVSWLQDEANAVTKITKKNKESIDKAFEKLLDQIHEDGAALTKRLQDKCNIANNEDSSKNENVEREILSKIEKINNITAQIQDYEEKISNITSLRTAEINNHTDCMPKITAHKRAIQYFETVFDINIISCKTNEHEIIIQLVYKGFGQYPVTLVFDQDIQIKSFQVKGDNNEKYSELENWFKTSDMNPTKLMIKLRRYVTNLV